MLYLFPFMVLIVIFGRILIPCRSEKAPQDWCASVIAMGKELIRLVTEAYPTGLQWKEGGVDTSEYSAPAPAATPTPAAPTPAVVEEKAGSATAMSKLQEERARMAANRNADGSLKLKHVEKSEMSHKNPALRGNVKMAEKKVT